MNKMLKAKVRRLAAKQAHDNAIIERGYEAIAEQYPGRAHRTIEQYFSRLEECEACCPGGFCDECGCNYKAKLVLRAFTCGKGKFKND
jgi:hypothetical protein